MAKEKEETKPKLPVEKSPVEEIRKEDEKPGKPPLEAEKPKKEKPKTKDVVLTIQGKPVIKRVTID